MPAVSTKRTGPSSVSTRVSMASRVVPGRSWTTARSSPVSRLNSVDLPTLGRPTIATATPAVPMPSLFSVSTGASSNGTTSSAPSSGKNVTAASSRSPVPRPCRALTGYGSPRPRVSRSHTAGSWAVSSTLFATSRTGLPDRRATSATWASSSVTPTMASTTSRTTSASASAFSDCLLTLASRSVPPTVHPPVSTRRKDRPSQSASTSLRSRVTPGFSSTMAARRPTTRLRRVDLPTLGRPTMATTGRLIGSPPRRRALRQARRRAPRQARRRARQVGRLGAVEEPALREAHVGEQVAVALGLAGQHAGQVGPHHQPGHGDVAPEELVVDHDEAHVRPAQPREQRRQDAGAVRGGEDAHRGAAAGADVEPGAAGRAGPDAPVGLVVGADGEGEVGAA